MLSDTQNGPRPNKEPQPPPHTTTCAQIKDWKGSDRLNPKIRLHSTHHQAHLVATTETKSTTTTPVTFRTGPKGDGNWSTILLGVPHVRWKVKNKLRCYPRIQAPHLSFSNIQENKIIRAWVHQNVKKNEFSSFWRALIVFLTSKMQLKFDVFP